MTRSDRKDKLSEEDRNKKPDLTVPQADEPTIESPEIEQGIQPPAEFFVVGVGASAGGLSAFRAFLQSIPDGSGLAFVLIQHLDPTHESMMVELLVKSTSMTVQQAEHGMVVEPDHVYVIPPNNYLDLVDRRLLLSEFKGKRRPQLPIDHFFTSIASAHRDLAVGIILSGTGSDGALGIREIKAAGGLTMAQKPDTAEFEGMPRAAIATKHIDEVLPIDAMANVLTRHVGPISGLNPLDNNADTLLVERDHFKAILDVLQGRTEHDFHCYKKATLERRIARRMNLRQIDSLEDYVEMLNGDSNELNALFKDLLISVTRFFRDGEAWEALKSKVIAPLVARSDESEEPIRVWVPGCATGEEAYSIAMLIMEQLDLQQKDRPLQVFGTDLDQDAINVARNGLYAANIEDDVGASRVKRFFSEDEGGFRTSKRLREATIFAVQNLVCDPPFSKLDLISCRNLMIYLNAETQGKLIDLFHFALRSHGCLFIGSSESLGSRASSFETLDKTWRVFRTRAENRHVALKFPAISSLTKPLSEPRHLPTAPLVRSVAERVHRGLSETFVPPTVAVSYTHEVRYFHGAVARYLEFPGGEPNVNLFNMIPDEAFRGKLSALIYRVSSDATGETTASLRTQYQRFGETHGIVIHVKSLPAEYGGEPLLLISFDQESSIRGQVMATEVHAFDNQSPADIESVRENLQTTVEQLETANEELKASNEEVMSMNEELQSANEELETSREELQSLNEELSTVNSQLSEKVDELAETNNDLKNLLSSTKVATIFLDTQFRIRRFTSATRALLNVIDTDVGRPISDLAMRVMDPDLAEHARQVLDRLTPIEAELQSGEKTWFLRRILPYRTADNVIDGVVITYHDVSTMKQTTKQLEARERQQGMVAGLGRKALIKPGIAALLDEAAQTLAVSMDVDFVDVLEAQDDGKAFLLSAGVGWPKREIGKAVIPGSPSNRAGVLFREGGAVIIKDDAHDIRLKPDDFLLKHGVASGVNVLIGKRDRPWGILGVHAREARKFTTDDVNLLDAVANILWSAIQAERDFTRVVDSNEELRSRLSKLES